MLNSIQGNRQTMGNKEPINIGNKESFFIYHNLPSTDSLGKKPLTSNTTDRVFDKLSISIPVNS